MSSEDLGKLGSSVAEVLAPDFNFWKCFIGVSGGVGKNV